MKALLSCGRELQTTNEKQQIQASKILQTWPHKQYKSVTINTNET